MSKEHNQPHHRPQANGPLSDVKAIPVAIMQFHDVMEIPGKLSSQGLRAEQNVNRRHWRISYLPALRCYELTCFVPGKDGPDGTYYVHEHRVAWWQPLA